MKMYKKIIAGMIVGTIMMSSVLGVFAAPSRQDDIYVSGDDKDKFEIVKDDTAFDEVLPTDEELYEQLKEGDVKLPDDIKKELEGKTLIWEIFDIDPIVDGEKAPYEIELTVTTLTNYGSDISILVYNEEEGTWEVVEPLHVDYKNKKVVIKVDYISAIGIYAKIAESKPEGTAPSTENTSSAWMIWAAMAVVALGAGVVVSQKKRG